MLQVEGRDFLAIHCSIHWCMHAFDHTKVIFSHLVDRAHMIVGAAHTQALSQWKLAFLEGACVASGQGGYVCMPRFVLSSAFPMAAANNKPEVSTRLLISVSPVLLQAALLYQQWKTN